MVCNAQVWAQNHVDGSVVLGTQTCNVDVSSWRVVIIPGQRRRKDSSPILQYTHVCRGTMSHLFDIMGIETAAGV